LPSGDSRPATWVGLPNIFSRGISGTSAKAGAGMAATVRPAQAESSKVLAFIWNSSVGWDSADHSVLEH
jgi:hypothetical protein